jgi:hypothetical protein
MLSLCWCWEVTDDGVMMVISHCSQLRVLDLLGVVHITGICTFGSDPQPALHYLTPWCIVFLQHLIVIQLMKELAAVMSLEGSSVITNAHLWTIL